MVLCEFEINLMRQNSMKMRSDLRKFKWNQIEWVKKIIGIYMKTAVHLQLLKYVLNEFTLLRRLIRRKA